MQINDIVGKREMYLLKTLFAQSKRGQYKTERSPAFTKSAAETIAILLICALLLVAGIIATLKFMEFLIYLFNQTFFVPLIRETPETITNLSGFIEAALLNF